MPLASIIVITFNSEETIPHVIRGLEAQTFRDFEVIVVDNGSTDYTVELMQKVEHTLIQSLGTRTYIRKLGANHARGRYLFFLDADEELAPEALAKSVALFQRGYEAVAAERKQVGGGYWERCKNFGNRLYRGEKGYIYARFIEAEIYSRIGGHNADLTANEDFDVQIRLMKSDARIAFLYNMVRHYEPDWSFKKAISKTKLYERTMSRFHENHPGSLNEFRTPLPKLVIRRWHQFFLDPVHGFGWTFLLISRFFVSKYQRS